jgi:hypothetical protein
LSERDQLVIDLVKEVLGPRNGPHETLPSNQDPRDEYITGVLAPAQSVRPSDDIEADIEEVIEETSSEEDQDNQGYAVVPGIFSPALDPKALPRSIGLSFTLTANNYVPQIEVCATWARYQANTNGDWQRVPGYFLTGKIPADQDREWNAASGLSLKMRSQLLKNGNRRVSLFLINVTGVEDPDSRPATKEYIFQPQIRVVCCPGTALVPVMSDGPESQFEASHLAAEDASLALLYRDRTALARGHLCGATWKDIDPERPHPSLPSPLYAPFAWTDAGIVPNAERAKFSPPDVRTDMVPVYPVEAPEMGWDDEFAAPEFDPEILAETWASSDIISRLQSLADGYGEWIRRQRSTHNLSHGQQQIAAEHLTRCEQVAHRIQEAIQILATDEDVRLAFCFANKAVAMQSRWARGRVLTWRPFQLAFILMNIPAIANPLHADRRICDLLWFPTGGGKTEAYLGLSAFTLALRRRRIPDRDGDLSGGGVGVLSRYTLRLLTIQQFRRALGIITACEVLRVANLDTSGVPVGWRPAACPNRDTFLWGGTRFSAGLWVGGGVTPNSLLSTGPIPSPTNRMVFYPGAIDILKGVSKRGYDGPDQALRKKLRNADVRDISEPAQVLNCPVCSSILAVPDEGLAQGKHTLRFVFQGGQPATPPLMRLAPPNMGTVLTLDSVNLFSHAVGNYRTLSLTFTVADGNRLRPYQVDEWWYQTIAPAFGQNVELIAVRPSRPGYFLLTYDNAQNNTPPCDFNVYCPNHECELNQHAWAELVPVARDSQSAAPQQSGRGGQMSMGVMASGTTAALPNINRTQWQQLPEWSRRGNSPRISNYIPIPAFTVDDQVYHRCPSLIVATVDKIARLAFEAKAASLFGHVSHYHSRWGYYREGTPPSWGNLPNARQPHPPGRATNSPLHVAVQPFSPPDLILQDELHLIEGPLGSMVGLYETTIDLLCQRQVGEQVIIPKYVASTATVRQAEPQVQALFDRRLVQFPPSGVNADDRFFARDSESHPLECTRPGRLYVAVCAPGKGAQTPIVRLWSSLLQSAYDQWRTSGNMAVDRFWTLVGYFNAIRELAGALSLYRQDIPERIRFRAGANERPLNDHLELSSRASSLDLPSMLESLNVQLPTGRDAVLATSMFGTGVDVDRLGLMVVHGQPKTTASYIQATGRVGRQGGGLIVTFFRASRPRDLDHYEFFTGYHRALYRYVEPITVAPFSPRARERGLGPLSVILLRHAASLCGTPVHAEWAIQQRLNGAFHANALRMARNRHSVDVEAIPDLLESRAQQQPDGRRPPADITAQETHSELDRWAMIAGLHPDHDGFVYNEPALLRPPERHVVLGDAQHRLQGYDEAFENTPQSLREVEETTTFKS